MYRPQQILARKINRSRQRKPTGIPLINTVRQDRPAKRKAPTLQRVAKRKRLARQLARKIAKAKAQKRKAKQAQHDPLIKPVKKRYTLQARGR